MSDNTHPDSSLRSLDFASFRWIPARHLQRVFEPFFTTKAGDTGRGLAIACNSARANGGDLILSANKRDRICFATSLPASNHQKGS